MYALHNRGISLDQLHDYPAAIADFTAVIQQVGSVPPGADE